MLQENSEKLTIERRYYIKHHLRDDKRSKDDEEHIEYYQFSKFIKYEGEGAAYDDNGEITKVFIYNTHNIFTKHRGCATLFYNKEMAEKVKDIMRNEPYFNKLEIVEKRIWTN